MNQIIKVFKALSNENRLSIINFLKTGEKCGCEIQEKINIIQSKLSHHLKVLSECELINSRKEGLRIYYSLNNPVIKIIKTYFSNLETKPKKIHSSFCKR